MIQSQLEHLWEAGAVLEKSMWGAEDATFSIGWGRGEAEPFPGSAVRNTFGHLGCSELRCQFLNTYAPISFDCKHTNTLQPE